MLSRLIVSLVPAGARARFRRSTLVRGAMKRIWGGIRNRPFLDSPYRFYYDGYRNIGFESHNFNELERNERAAVAHVCMRHPAACVWDIGANIGFWSLFFSTVAPAGAEIVSFEPDSENLQVLQMNRDRNGLNWRIRAVGLSDHAGESKFYTDPVTGATGSVEKDHDFIGQFYAATRRTLTISLSTMDAEVAAGARPPQFIKMDVEGHELAVLQGGRELLSRYRPCMIFETTRNQVPIAQLFIACGYRLFDTAGRHLKEPAFSTLAIPTEIADIVWA